MFLFDACSKCFSGAWAGEGDWDILHPRRLESSGMISQGENSLGTWTVFLRISTGSKGKKENNHLLPRKCPYKRQISSIRDQILI